MGLPFNIPLTIPIPTVTQSAIPFRIDQIVRLLFQFQPQTAPSFTSAADVQDKTVWDALMTAGDVTQVTISPVFAAPKITGGKRLEVGGDTNNTFAGLPMTFQKGVVRFAGEFQCKDAASVASLDALFQYSQQNTVGGTNLGVFMINSAKPNGMVFTNSNFSFIPIWNFLVQPRTSDGYAAMDKCEFAFDMLPTWADRLTCTIPNFDPNSAYTS